MPGTAGHNLVVLSEVAGLAAGVVYLAAIDPHDPRAKMPVCLVKLISGLDCPACGGLRLVHDLLHGNVRAAVHDNPFMLLCSPVLLYLLVCHWRAARSGEPARIPRLLAYSLAGTAFIWMVVRNLPGWPLKPTVA
jgi:hypothetical protein